MCIPKNNPGKVKITQLKKIFVRFVLRQSSAAEDQQINETEESRLMTSEQWENPEEVQEFFPAPDSDKLYSNLKQYISHNDTKIRKIPFFKRWYVAASVAAAVTGIAVFLAVTWLQPEATQIISERTGKGQRLQLELPDGSKVWMNGESELTYSLAMNEAETREVKLDGEAFFEVKSSEEHPFVVSSHGLKVKATGTRFNVTNYQNDRYATAMLVEGRIGVYQGFPERKDSLISFLYQDMTLRYDKSEGKFTRAEVDAAQYATWRHGTLIFDNEPLAEVARRLGHWYGMEFVVDDKLIGENRYTFTLEGDSLTDVLKWLRKTTDMQVKKERGKVFLRSVKESSEK